MASNVTIDGSTYSIPDPRDKNYVAGSTGLTAYLKKIATAFSTRPSSRRYTIGQTYNSILFEVVSDDLSFFAPVGYAVVSQTGNGAYAMEFILAAQCNPWTAQVISIAGVSFDAVTYQVVPTLNDHPTSTPKGYTTPSSGDINLSVDPSGASTSVYITGTLQLASKPTWAD